MRHTDIVPCLQEYLMLSAKRSSDEGSSSNHLQTCLDLEISHGSAVAIEKQWKEDIGTANANAILDLAKIMKKLGIEPAESVHGLEIAAALKELGTKPEGMKRFLSELSEGLIAKGIPASKAADILSQMTELTNEFRAPLDKVPGLLEGALKRLREVEQKLTDSSNRYEEVQKRLNAALEEMSTTRENVGKCVEVENKLKALGLSLSKIDEAVNLIRNTETLGQDPAKVAAAFALFDSLQRERDAIKGEIESAKRNLQLMRDSIARLNSELSALAGMKAFLDKFIAAGFNEKMLEELLELLKDVALQRSIPTHLSAAFFLSEAESSFDHVLGYKRTLADFEEKTLKASKDLAKAQTEFAEYEDATESLMLLREKGIQEKDLIYWHKVLRDHPRLSPEMLTECLRDYGDLKEALISLEAARKEQESKIGSLRIDIEALQEDKGRAERELKELRKTESEKLDQHIIQLEELQKQQRDLLVKMASEVLNEATKKALRAGISLQASKSVLLPIILSENGGPSPKSEELIIAGVYLLSLLERDTNPSDPIRRDLAGVIGVLKKRLDSK